MSQILQKMYSFETNNCSYLAVTNDGKLNRRNNETYDLYHKKKKLTTVKIIIDHTIIHCSINVHNLKRLYRFKWNNLNYLDYDGDCFNNEECDLKVRIVAGM